MTTPDPANFEVVSHKGEFRVRINITGSYTFDIKADDLEAAKKLADSHIDQIVEDPYYAHDLDDVDGADHDVWAKPDMYRVNRNGTPMQVSHLKDGDEPRVTESVGF